MSYFADFFPLLDEDKIKPKFPKAYLAYNKIKKSKDGAALKYFIDTAVKRGSDIFKTPSNKAITTYREAGRVLRTKPTSKAARDLKSADSRLVRLVNAANRNQRKIRKGYPVNGVVYLGAM